MPASSYNKTVPEGGGQMTVYADVLVIVNLYIDFFLLWCVKKALGLSAKRRRLALGALLGGIVSLAALLPMPGWACWWAFSPRWG